ncbi:MAG TPA: GatB/YqeY domain-containing protein [Candidatus Absconditabacterales bacterium]|nr:GatB/YqeY domain-containing protein [Candidatus Absconditabacterales bacterium]HOQ78675.1 GatB/YqeY domain-containing protein [Candidatus Absconditabacterales bacterium]HPK28028.1 GatB/YqeY domain-containing protein [Candidatus Absconditabacterales bacterium]
MSLQEKLFADYMQAMKDKDVSKKAILNYVIAQIKNKKIELQKDLEDGEVIKILKKEIKALVEAIGFLGQANKLKELKEEQAKKQVLEQYLPQTKSKEETKEIVLNLIKELGITELTKQRGQVMGAIKSQYGEVVEGSLANEVINEILKGS